MDEMIIKLQQLLIFMPFFLIAVAFHEVAHGYAAYMLGDPTAKNAGRLSLNPMVHVDPVGSLMFLISYMVGFGFGWAKPVPVNPALLRNPRRDDIIVSLAGVTANFILMVISIILLKSIYAFVPYQFAQENSNLMIIIIKIISLFIMLNMILIIFNLIPIPPLDGSHVLMSILPLNQARAFANIRPYGFILIILLLSTGITSYLLNFGLNFFDRIFIFRSLLIF